MVDKALRAIPCFSTLGCGELELHEVLALAVRRKMPAVELRTLAGSNALPEYFETNYGTPERLADLVRAYPVRIASLDSSCHAIDTPLEGRAELRALAPWAAAAEVPTIRVFDGGERGDDGEIASAQPLFEWWHSLEVAPQLAVETHDALAHPDALQRFIERYPSVRILWDTHHTWKEGAERPSRTWERLRGRSRHLHVKDSSATGNYVAPGTGTYPFRELLDALRTDRFDGVLSLEWERHWYPDLPPIADALDGFDAVLASTP
jgi:sugar phosphate isomerase/epimerase